MDTSPALALKKAEAAAAAKKAAAKEAKSAESEPDSADSFSYNPISPSSSKSKFSFKTTGKKKIAPLILFGGILLAAIVVLFTSNSLLPGHFNANTIESFDVQYSANKIAEKTVTSGMLATGSIPTEFAERLTNSGLTIGYLDSNQNFIAGLRPNPDTTISLASAKDAKDENTDQSLVINFKGNIITYADINDYFNTDPEFYAAFDEATYGRAIGHFDSAANDFYADILNTTRDVFKNYKSTGDITSDTEAFNEAFSAIFGETSSSLNTVVDVTANINSDINGPMGFKPKLIGCWGPTNEREGESGAPGPCYEYKTIDGVSKYILIDGYTDASEETSACALYGKLYNVKTTYANNGTEDVCYAETVPSTDGEASNGSDSYINALYAMSYSTKNDLDAEYRTAAILNQAINANETYQSMEYYLAIEEAISKMMAGKGESSPINPILNALTTTTTSSDASGNTVTGSALQAPGLSAVLTKSYPSSLPASTSPSSVDRVIENATVALLELTGKKLAKTVSTDAVSSVTDAMNTSMSNTKISTGSFISDFGCYFIGKIEDINSKATGSILAAVTPSISQSIIFGDTDKLTGIAMGEFLGLGGSALGSKIASFASGATVGDEVSIAAYQGTTDHILALEAAADRATHSPLDITNKNTFLGSIASSLTTATLKAPTLSSLYGTINHLKNTSLASLLPSALADGAENDWLTTYGNNCEAENIHGKANAYCIPTQVFDTTTIESALMSSDFETFLSNNIEDDGESIKAGSDLELFLTYNNGRQSNVGSKNNNIYNAFVTQSDTSTFNAFAGSNSSGFLGSIKKFFNKIGDKIKSFVSSVSSIFTSSHSKEGNTNVINSLEVESKYDEDQQARIERISTGEEFANTTSNPYWETYRYAQTKILYDRVLDQMSYYSESNTNTASLSAYFTPGTGKSSTGAYLAAIADSIPDDESDAEYLSRISGLTLKDSTFALNYFTVATYLANFDYDSVPYPSTLVALIAPKPPKTTIKNIKTDGLTPVSNTKNHSERLEYYASL